MTQKTKKCKTCKKTISSPKRIPICDACRNNGIQWTGVGVALLVFFNKTIKTINKKN